MVVVVVVVVVATWLGGQADEASDAALLGVPRSQLVSACEAPHSLRPPPTD